LFPEFLKLHLTVFNTEDDEQYKIGFSTEIIPRCIGKPLTFDMLHIFKTLAITALCAREDQLYKNMRCFG
jgi:hypothetical protein